MLIVMYQMSKAFTNQIVLSPGAWWKTVSKEFLLHIIGMSFGYEVNLIILSLLLSFPFFPSLFFFFFLVFFSPHFMSSLEEIWFLLPWKLWKRFYPALPVWPCAHALQWGAPVNLAKAARESYSLIFNCLCLHMQSQSHRSNMLFIFIPGTEHSVRCFHQTGRQWLIDDHLYSAILRSLEQTHCARMWFYMSD